MNISPRYKVFLHDFVAINAAWLMAVFARFNFEMPPEEILHPVLAALPLAVIVQALVSWRFGLYRGLWRFASLPDLVNIIRAAALGTILIGVGLFIVNRLEGIPRSLLVLYPFFLVFLLGGPRLLYRVWKDHTLNLRSVYGGERVVVVGGGSGGETVVRDMLRERSFIPVAIVDDDPALSRSRIHGVPVLGTIDDLPAVVERRDAETIVIAIPSSSNAQMRRIVQRCEEARIPFRTLPQLHDMVSGRVSVAALREVSIDDLLGRDKVELDWTSIQLGIAGKSVLVSGGGGSIGAELCRQIAALGAARLIVFERSEFNLYSIERELRDKFPHLNLVSVIGDVCDNAAVNRVFSQYRPAFVFHAAAYKHVPVLQNQVREALRNNVLGTLEMLDAAERYNCGAFVLISTDKAVRPSSVMGASKRVAELVCESRQRVSGTRVITVRFGNVLGSAGSVVPLFREQIAAGGPVTVTHPDACRYFMTIPEACQLILLAGTSGHGGEIFVLDMGEPVNITYLAEQMIRLSGQEPGADIRIEYIGLRGGEKLNEELFRDDEQLNPTAHNKLLLAQHVPVDHAHLARVISKIDDAVAAFDEDRLAALLGELVPEFARTQDKPEAAASIVSITRSVS